MALLRLCKTAGKIIQESRMLQRHLAPRAVIRTFKNERSKPLDNTTDDLDTPLKFRGTKAESWKAERTRSPSYDDDSPWYQSYVITLSLSIFLIYFCILREENDIDEALGASLYDHVDGMEEKQLEIAIAYRAEHGLDTKDLAIRLKEIRDNK